MVYGSPEILGSKVTTMARPRSLSTLRLSLLPALALALALAACEGGAAERDCVIDAECVSGHCLAGGTCMEMDETWAEAGDTSPSFDATDSPGGDDVLAGDDGAGTLDDDTPLDPDPADDDPTTAGPGCVPDHDGVVTRAEAPIAAGYVANFLVTTDVGDYSTWAECAAPDGCGWDLVDVPGSTTEQLSETLPPDGHWFSDQPAFADATYVAAMGEVDLGFLFIDICNQTQLGIWQATDDALLLLGMASDTADGDTLLVYDPPLPFLQFPLEQGATWQTDTHAKGPFCGSWVDYDIAQTLTASVDAVGSVITPYGTFEDVLRVNTLLERHLGVGVLPTKVRTHTFVAECFTTIAAIVSQEGEGAAEFDAVSEVRRLTNLP